ncbi:MAG: amidohydrolase family protein [Lachnospiraceae bacterium]|nr:amidohydrolase family protein [Lachnospiraceae bacterium]
MKMLLKNAHVCRDAYSGFRREDLLVEDDRIAGFFAPGDSGPQDCAEKDLTGCMIIPGMVQTHVHLCQVLFRGLADDLPLLSWLKTRIWPLEAAHDRESTYLSAMLGITELIAGGVTCVCDMESVRYADEAARALAGTGMRAVFGKVLMDYNDTPEELGGMPKPFFETTKETLERAKELIDAWHGAENGRIHYAYMPRGVLTTTPELFQELIRLSKENHCLIHTHACETEPESLLVKERRGATEIKYLDRLGLAGENLLLAHCQYVDEEDLNILEEKRIGVASCVLTNLKLGSGIAPLEKMRHRGIRLSFGSDGAPANNNLDMFQEMKTASLLQKGVLHDPTAMPAETVFDIATMGGARVLGMEHEIGSLEVGKKADLAVLTADGPETAPLQMNAAMLVYSGNPHMVRDVMIDGKWVYRNRTFENLDLERLHAEALAAQRRVAEKVL